MRIKRLLGCTEEAQPSQFAALTLAALIVAVAGSYVATLARAQPKSAHPVSLSVGATGITPNYTIGGPEQDRMIPLKSNPQAAQLAAGIMASRKVSYQPQSAATGQAVRADGEITGVVIDPTDALVPRASVRAINTDTRVAIARVTDNSGTYSLAPLPPGKYNVEVLAPGFQRLIQQNISIDGPQKIVLNLKLKVGAVAQNLTVAVPPSVVVAAPSPVEVPKATPGLPLRVSAGTLAGNLVTKVDPVYPAVAKADHVQGVVVLHAIVSKMGSIENVEVVSGPPALLVSAIDAVRQWKYKPYLLNGEPTAVETTININYTFSDPTEQQGQIGATDASPAPRKIGDGVSTPTLIYQVEPEMTPEAKKAQFMGIVLVNLIVDASGMPQNVHVLHGIGMGLDEKAVEAVKQYKFKPAMEGGRPVPVQMNVEVNFKIF